MKSAQDIKLIFLTAEEWPTFRQDVVTLFGKYLPGFHIKSFLVTEESKHSEKLKWLGGDSAVCQSSKSRSVRYVVKFFHQLKFLVSISSKEFDAIQVRDMPFIGFVGLIVAKLKRKPFFYWMSYPMSEDQVIRAKRRGIKAGIRYFFPLIQGGIGKFILYKCVLPFSSHIFVQSDQMLKDVEKHSIDIKKMTAVPMGVDPDRLSFKSKATPLDSVLKNRRILVYLGTLNPARKIDFLLQVTAQLKLTYPSILLLLVGDTDEQLHRDWLLNQIDTLDIKDNVIITGWLDMDSAWDYASKAEIGLSHFPRSFLLDSASPTKAVEYMAIGLPVVVNDNPDQEKVINESGAGICVPMEIADFVSAIECLLEEEGLRIEMRIKGRGYIESVRSYKVIANDLANVYKKITL